MPASIVVFMSSRIFVMTFVSVRLALRMLHLIDNSQLSLIGIRRQETIAAGERRARLETGCEAERENPCYLPEKQRFFAGVCRRVIVA